MRLNRIAITVWGFWSLSFCLAVLPSMWTPAWPRGAEFVLTVLHHGDGESHLIDAGRDLKDFGGIARFASLVKRLKKEARRGLGKRAFVLISAGDNFLAGPEFAASLEAGRFFDAIGLRIIKYDALVIGNHEFDLGPDVLEGFIRTVAKRKRPFISANLNFSLEPGLQALADRKRIVKTQVVKKKGERIGIIGLTTPDLPILSSPRNVKVNSDLVGVVQAEVDQLLAGGVSKIILATHLQTISNDIALAASLRGVDIIVSGGGHDILANEGDRLVPGDEDGVFGPYPVEAQDADGNTVYIVSTDSDYKYVGRLIASFDDWGRCIAIDPRSGPLRVAGGGNEDAVKPLKKILRRVTNPVVKFVEGLAGTIIATSDVPLDGRRAENFGITVEETNYGNLIADAVRVIARAEASNFGAPLPDIGLQNGGGIRNNDIVPAGDYSLRDSFDAFPFSNLVSMVADIPPAQLKEIMENAVSMIGIASPRFAQISGFSMIWDANGTAQELDEDGNVTTPGTRIRHLQLDDGTEIVTNGQVVPGSRQVSMAIINFLARGGDDYPFRGKEFTTLGVSEQQALARYLEEVLNGKITAAMYPAGGEGRITRLNSGVTNIGTTTYAQRSRPALSGTMAAAHPWQPGRPKQIDDSAVGRADLVWQNDRCIADRHLGGGDVGKMIVFFPMCD